MAQRTVGQWVLEQEIGSGSFAVVWRARHATTGDRAAVKEINTDKLNKKLYESLASEVAVLDQTQHDNIVRLLDLLKEGNRIYIVLEYCSGGDLGQYIRRYGRVSEATARYFLQQLAEGLKELRKHHVIHRDLKPQNLLLSDATANPLLKIADFGFARNLAPQGLAETLCGSPLYMAPEILQFHKYDAKADLWSIGTILFELVGGKPPFNGANHVQLLQNIQHTEARLPEHIACRLSSSCRALISQLLKRNPVERITFEEFFQHPFLTGPAGPSQGVPPPVPVNVNPLGDQAEVPWRVRQAAAAAAAAGQGPAQAGRPGSAGLHPPQQQQQPELQGQQGSKQQQQGQEAGDGPGSQQSNKGAEQQPQQVQKLTVERYQRAQQQQVQQLVLTQQPVVRHPLSEPAAEAGPSKGGLPKPLSALDLSDSIEQDYVVVINPFKPDIAMARRHAEQLQASSSHSQSGASNKTSQQQQADPQLLLPQQQQQHGAAAVGGAMVESMQTASAASSGSHANSSTTMSAAVAALEGQPVGASPHQQQQQQCLASGQAAQLPDGVGGARDKQLLQGVPGVAAVAAAAGRRGRGATAPAAAADWVGRAPTSLRGTASELLQLSQNVNKVQLLAQVLRGILELLQQQEAGHEGVVPLQQQAESVALRLFALQLLSLLCIPQQQQEKQPQEVPGQQQQQQQRGVEALAEGQEPEGEVISELQQQPVGRALAEQEGSDARLGVQQQQQESSSCGQQLLLGSGHLHSTVSPVGTGGGDGGGVDAGGNTSALATAAAAAAPAGDLLSAADPEDLQLLMASALQLLQLLQSAAQEERGAGSQSLFGSILKQRAAGQGQQQLLQLQASAAAAAALVEGSGHQGGSGLAAVSEGAMGLVLPDPWQVLYQHALSSSRSAAVEELMGNWRACISSYSLAADLLMFLAMEWGELGGWSAGLSWSERVRVHGLYAAVYGRLMLCLKEKGERSS